jgi:hypothetical protein
MRSMVDFTHNHHNTNRTKTRRAVWCDWSAAATKGRAALGTGTLHSHAPCEAWSPLVGGSPQSAGLTGRHTGAACTASGLPAERRTCS